MKEEKKVQKKGDACKSKSLLFGARVISAAIYQTFTSFSVHYRVSNYYYLHLTDKETDSKEVKWGGVPLAQRCCL